MEEILQRYHTKYGKRLDETLGEIAKTIIAESDGDSLALLFEHLEQAKRLIVELAQAGQIIVRNDQKAPLN
jgi:hypothetical protein